MDKKMKEQLLDVLKEVIPYVKGILIYGSFITGYADVNSDIDICVIQKDEGKEGEDLNLKELYKKILRVSANKRYDIVIFNEIPWYLRGEILKNNEVLYAENADELDFWLYKRSKIWNGMKRRQSLVSADDLIERLKLREKELTRGGEE